MNLAKAVGNPTQMDEATSKGLRPSLARVCVEFNCLQTPPAEIFIQIKNQISNENVGGFWQKVIFEKMPAYCSHCMHLGHSKSSCILLVGKPKGKEVPPPPHAFPSPAHTIAQPTSEATAPPPAQPPTQSAAQPTAQPSAQPAAPPTVPSIAQAAAPYVAQPATLPPPAVLATFATPPAAQPLASLIPAAAEWVIVKSKNNKTKQYLPKAAPSRLPPAPASSTNYFAPLSTNSSHLVSAVPDTPISPLVVLPSRSPRSTASLLDTAKQKGLDIDLAGIVSTGSALLGACLVDAPSSSRQPFAPSLPRPPLHPSPVLLDGESSSSLPPLRTLSHAPVDLAVSPVTSPSTHLPHVLYNTSVGATNALDVAADGPAHFDAEQVDDDAAGADDDVDGDDASSSSSPCADWEAALPDCYRQRVCTNPLCRCK